MKELLKNLLRKAFETGQYLGLDVLPRHFYSSIPDIRSLKKDTYWKIPLSMQGIHQSSVSEQLDFIENCVAEVKNEVLLDTKIYQDGITRSAEIGYGLIEADFLYAFIKKNKPNKIIQIGCGVSTAIVLNASEAAGYQPEIICIEPYPSPFLERIDKEGHITLIKELAQKVSLEVLTNLRLGDLFFVDSTHTVKVGSEVNKVILEALPRLMKGVYIHFHDIYFPYEYQRNILGDNLFFWNETILLYAYLLNNEKITIKACMSLLHYQASEKLKKIFPNYIPQSNDEGIAVGKKEGKHFPSSIYLQTIN